MAENLSLWEFLRELVTNAGLRDRFAADPQGALRANGLDHLSPDDVHDALVLAEDNQTADFSRHYDTGHTAIGFSPPAPLVGETEHEAAIRYLTTYVTNNSVDQQVHTGGGDFDQDIDVHSAVASGAGAVAAGGVISGSTVTTGDGDQVGDGDVAGGGSVVGDRNPAVTGDHDTTAFGSGNATGTTVHGDVSVGDGGAFASGGDAGVDDPDHSLHGVGDTSTDNAVHGPFTGSSDHGVAHSFDTETDAGTRDSFDDDSHTAVNHSFDDATHVDNGLDHVGGH